MSTYCTYFRCMLVRYLLLQVCLIRSAEPTARTAPIVVSTHSCYHRSFIMVNTAVRTSGNKIRRGENMSHGQEEDSFSSPEEKPFHSNGNPRPRGRNPLPPPGGRNVFKHVGKPSLLPGTCRHGGHRATHPREGTFPPPPRRSLTNWLAPHLLPETPKCRTAVWGRRGVFAQRRRVRWRSGEPVSRGAY